MAHAHAPQPAGSGSCGPGAIQCLTHAFGGAEWSSLLQHVIPQVGEASTCTMRQGSADSLVG